MRDTITKEKIIEATWQLLDNAGLPGLSMRKLADALGIKAATLYWHFPNKQTLLNALIDEVTAEAMSHFPADGDWQERLRQSSVAFADALRKYPFSADLMLDGAPQAPNYLKLIDRLLQIIDNLSMSDQEKFYGIAMLQDYILSFESDYLVQHRSERNREAASVTENLPTLGRMFDHQLFRDLGTKDMLLWGLGIIIDGINRKQHDQKK